MNHHIKRFIITARIYATIHTTALKNFFMSYSY